MVYLLALCWIVSTVLLGWRVYLLEWRIWVSKEDGSLHWRIPTLSADTGTDD